jgi:hypothetical protein
MVSKHDETRDSVMRKIPTKLQQRVSQKMTTEAQDETRNSVV